MDCQEVRDLLDAYALGAAEKTEAEGVEEHIADCVRCWDELSKAQQAAALLALSIPLQQPPERVRERVLSQAARERRRAAAGPGLVGRLRLNWQGAAGALGAVGVAALAFAVFLQVQLSDLRADRGDLEEQVRAADTTLAEQKQIFAVLSASDAQKLAMQDLSPETDASGSYTWSRSATKGFLVCQGLPPLAEDQVYQVWFTWDREAQTAGTFWSADGTCQMPMDLGFIERPPDGIGVTAERAGGAERPSEDWLLYADFDR